MSRAKAKKPVARKPQRRKAVVRRGKTKLIDRMVDMLPISREAAYKVTSYGIIAGVGVIALGAATLAGIPQWIGLQAGEVAGRAGFEVAKYEVSGIKRMKPDDVYLIMDQQNGKPLFNVDLDEVRDSLLGLGWVADAKVSRQMPDRLVATIVERAPAAVWQNGDELSLIDVEGNVIEKVSADRMPDLPLLVGPGANDHVLEFATLISAAPALKRSLAGGQWRGNRRWDIRFKTGELLSLPEGAAAAKKAFGKFATLDGTRRLLGRNIVRFDMRDPSRIVMKLPDGGSAAASTKDKQAETAKPEKREEG